jgi:hypothetical protein
MPRVRTVIGREREPAGPGHRQITVRAISRRISCEDKIDRRRKAETKKKEVRNTLEKKSGHTPYPELPHCSLQTPKNDTLGLTKIIFSEKIARPFGDLLGKYQGSLSSVAGGLLKISRMAGRAARIAVAMISGSDIPSARQLTR